MLRMVLTVSMYAWFTKFADVAEHSIKAFRRQKAVVISNSHQGNIKACSSNFKLEVENSF